MTNPQIKLLDGLLPFFAEFALPIYLFTSRVCELRHLFSLPADSSRSINPSAKKKFTNVSGAPQNEQHIFPKESKHPRKGWKGLKINQLCLGIGFDRSKPWTMKKMWDFFDISAPCQKKYAESVYVKNYAGFLLTEWGISFQSLTFLRWRFVSFGKCQQTWRFDPAKAHPLCGWERFGSNLIRDSRIFFVPLEYHDSTHLSKWGKQYETMSGKTFNYWSPVCFCSMERFNFFACNLSPFLRNRAGVKFKNAGLAADTRPSFNASYVAPRSR